MPRATVKLLLVDRDERLLLLRSTDASTGATQWYPVGGGVEDGESLVEAARREAHEETGLGEPFDGAHVWTRDHTYHYDGRSVEVHEDWLLVTVEHFEPVPTSLSDYEERSLSGACWWWPDELVTTAETVFPPDLGLRLAALLAEGPPATPIDISDPTAP